jgi:multiple sugar transport system substrate-binding protein
MSPAIHLQTARTGQKAREEGITVKKQISRRDFLRVGAATAAGAALAACAPQAPAPAPAAQPAEPAKAAEQPTTAPAAPAGATIRLSVWADVQDASEYDAMVKAFGQVKPEIKIATEQYSGDYYAKMQANFAGGDPADMLYMQGWMWQAYADSKVISPLDDLIKKDNMAGKWPESTGYKNMTTWRGATYMMPVDTGPLVVFYNKDLFDKAGVPYPKKGWTWEEFQAMIPKLTFEDAGVKYYGWAQAAGWNGAYGRVVTFMRRNGYLEWDRIMEPTKAMWDHPDIVSALQFIVEDVIAKNMSPSPEVIQGGGVGVDSGRVAMVLEGPWFLPRCWGPLSTLAKEKGGINFDVVDPPVGSSNKNNSFAHVHGHSLATAKNNKDAAWELAKFILGDDGQKIVAEGGRMCGHPDNIDKIWAPIATKTYNFTNSAAFSTGMREGDTPMVLGEGGKVNAYGGGPLNTLWDKLLGNQEPAASAVKTANAEIQTALDEYWAAHKS